jgi:hypothetical protein
MAMTFGTPHHEALALTLSAPSLTCGKEYAFGSPDFCDEIKSVLILIHATTAVEACRSKPIYQISLYAPQLQDFSDCSGSSKLVPLNPEFRLG